MQMWQLQDAKARFSEVIRMAASKPQVVTVHGREEVVVVSKKHYDKLVGKKTGLVSFLQSSPLKASALEFERDRSLPRELDL